MLHLFHDIVKHMNPVKEITLTRREDGSAISPPTQPRDEDAVARFVEQSAATLADMGFGRMPGKVLMLLMATEKPALTAADLAAGLQASPAAISNAVRFLIQVGMVERQAIPGARRDRYRLPDDAWYAASAVKQPAYRKLADIAREGVQLTGGPETPAGARLEDMQSFFHYLDTEMPGVVERWHKLRDRAALDER